MTLLITFLKSYIKIFFARGLFFSKSFVIEEPNIGDPDLAAAPVNSAGYFHIKSRQQTLLICIQLQQFPQQRPASVLLSLLIC